jgi:hypothetical protein
MRVSVGALVLLLVLSCEAAIGAETSRLKAVPFTEVTIEDQFWAPRMRTNREVTIPYCFKKCEETGRIDNFAKAAEMIEGKFKGTRYDDSDVFKVIEGASYSLHLYPDAQLDKYLDDLIAKIAGAQEDDGYLYTCRTIDANNPPDGAGKTRWSLLAQSHELYNVGHMYEAAVAHYRATSKRSLLDVAIKNADLIDRVFGPRKKHDVPGHEEIEIGLVKLYGVTGEDRYVKLAKFFIDQRGRAIGRKLYGEYAQDHKPVVEQDKAVGHAVRAGYLYSGMADVAAAVGDSEYVTALDNIWRDVVSGKMYITGGIGARHGGESFGDAYELPNKSAYCETCAAIANAMWNHRMFLLHEDGKYLDVVERVIYNGFLSGISLAGDRFFYQNPLANDGTYERSPWFDCACCPTNIVRFLPSLPGYAYACKGADVYVNLFIAGAVKIKTPNNAITLKQQTHYPWDGQITITVEPQELQRFAVNVRIPGWAQKDAVPSDLYRFAEASEQEVAVKVNGRSVRFEVEKGFARIVRSWQAGDTIELNLPMPIRRVLAHEKIKDDVGRAAIQRGPIVYCFEGVDNLQSVANLVLPLDAKLRAKERTDLLGGIVTLTGRGYVAEAQADGRVQLKETDVTAIPYYAWAHRGKNPMAVWITTSAEAMKK